MEPNATFFTLPEPGTEEDVLTSDNGRSSIGDHTGDGGRPHPLVSANAFPVSAEPGTEGGDPTSNKSPSLVVDNTRDGARSLPHQPRDSGVQSAADNAPVNGHSRRKDEITLSAACINRSHVSECGRVVADALKEGVAELRKDREVGTSQLISAIQRAISAPRDGEEIRIARSEKRVETDTASNPSTTERVGDEHHNDPLLGHFGGPDTPLFRAGLFLLLFGVTLVVYLWDLDVSAAGVTLVVISIGLAFCACIPIGNQPATPYRSRETGDSRAIVHRGRMEGCSVCDRTGCPAYKEKA